jgi:hypothetical protein
VTDRTLHIVVCSAPVASRIADGVIGVRANGWNPCVIPADAALPWLADQDLDDAPVITGDRTPDQPKRTPTGRRSRGSSRDFQYPQRLGKRHRQHLSALADGACSTTAHGAVCNSRSTHSRNRGAVHQARLSGTPCWLASLAVLRYGGVVAQSIVTLTYRLQVDRWPHE